MPVTMPAFSFTIVCAWAAVPASSAAANINVLNSIVGLLGMSVCLCGCAERDQGCFNGSTRLTQ